MLGVMMVRKDELKFREYDRYRGYYCGLCRAIGSRCGSVCRMALSFEMTFLAMLHTSLYEPETTCGKHRCLFHPVTKQLMLSNEAIDYAADLSALISYYDLRDGWEDERRVDKLAASEALRRRCAYLYIQYPDMEKELAILRAKLPHVDDRLCAQVALAVQKLRSNEAILKKPSIAETLDWAAALDALGIRELTPDALRQTAGFLLKNQEDLEVLEQEEVPAQPCSCGGHCGGHHHG